MERKDPVPKDPTHLVKTWKKHFCVDFGELSQAVENFLREALLRLSQQILSRIDAGVAAGLLCQAAVLLYKTLRNPLCR